MRVNEIFESLQGEGGRAGELSIFIRLAGCNRKCDFCDTEHENSIEMSLPEIYDYIQRKEFTATWIVWTGGEPTLQLTDEIVRYFRDWGYMQAIETNGSNPLPQGLDYIAISPKGEINPAITRVDEVRCVYPDHKLHINNISQLSAKLYLSPRFDGSEPNYDVINDCINYIRENPRWKLSIQIHKLLKIQ